VKPLFRALVARGVAHHDPTQVKIELTASCNLRCEHCYQDHVATPELSLAELERLFDALLEANTLLLVFTGGEPLRRKDFLEILAAARSRGFLIELLSNATLVDEPMVRRLRREGVQKVQVSLYGPEAAVHEAVTHVPGSFARTLRGIAQLRAAGIPVTIACSLLRQNVSHWRAIRRFVEDELRLELSLSFRLYESQANSQRLRQSALGLPEIRTYLQELYAEQTPRRPMPPTEEELDQLICLAAVNNCRILPHGDVMACAQLARPLGNVRETDFATIWRTSPIAERLRRMRRRDLVKCAGCSNYSICLICPGYFADMGNAFDPPAAFCAIAEVDSEERARATAAPGKEVSSSFSAHQDCNDV
jgi:radical SAM protein with 4Fe4S-binding SPASM domain